MNFSRGPRVLLAIGLLATGSLLFQTALGLQGEGTSPAKAPPRVAILIDDLGGSWKVAQEVLNLPAPITLSVLPHLSHSLRISEEAHRLSRQVLLHLPMEPHDLKRNPPGPGALFSIMEREIFLRTIKSSLASVPHAVGVNNHMGSKLSETPWAMGLVMSLLKSRGLFYVDSLTSPHSVAFQTARDFGVATLKRQIFLDNELESAAISARLEEVGEMALRRGKAVAIGHPHQKTLEALRVGLPRLLAKGVQVVPVSELLEGGDAGPRD